MSKTVAPTAPSLTCGIALLLATLLGAMAQSTPSAGKRPEYPGAAIGHYRIAGTVVNAATREPVRRATVAVLAEADSHTVESVETDNEGRFALEGLTAAKYQLTASKRGFLTAFYDEHDGGYNTAIVTGEGQQTSGLAFRLMPGAVLHGVVTGDGGDPVEGARVLLFMEPHNHNPGSRIALAGETATDDTGAYEFDNLAAGQYLLAVRSEPWYALHRSTAGQQQRPENDASAALDVAYPVTFFEATTDESTAARIVLAGGSRGEANINLHAVPALHLTVELPTKPEIRLARTELRQTIFGTEFPDASGGSPIGRQDETTEFDFRGVAPGHYELTQDDPPRIVELDATTSQHVDATQGTPTVAVSGSLQASNGAALPEYLRVSLRSLDGAQFQTPQQAAFIQGAFSFTAVPSGNWELEADSPGRVLAVSSLTVGSQTSAGGLLKVQDKPLSLQVTVSLSETRVEGFARKDGKGQAGVMVVLVPKEPTAFRALARRDQSDSDGSFSLRDVAPGQYTVVAIEDGWELDWAQSEVIGRYLRKGIAVIVTESSGKLLRLSEGVPVQSR